MNKEELKKTVSMNSRIMQRSGKSIIVIDLNTLVPLLDQLDEPDEYMDTALKLGQQLLEVQAQRDKAEKELVELKSTKPRKPVVPEFVAEFIVDYKEQGYTLANAIFNIATGREDMDIEEYLREHPKKFVQAYDDGYTVEKEKKYEVKDKDDCFLLTKNSEGEVINAYSKVVYKNKGQLTEKEIKDYDERFMAFAVPVEELEE